MEFNTFYIVFAVFGLGFSFFFGFNATKIFSVSTEGKSITWKFHQFWFNFLGSIFGWAALWFFMRKAYFCFQSSCPAHFDFMDLLVIFIAFVGITGYLPYTVMGLIQGISDLSKKIPGLGK